jgi:hypothetical protein
MALSTLDRYLKKQQTKPGQQGGDGVGRSRLVKVELAAAVVPVVAGDRPVSLTVLLSNGAEWKLVAALMRRRWRNL